MHRILLYKIVNILTMKARNRLQSTDNVEMSGLMATTHFLCHINHLQDITLQHIDVWQSSSKTPIQRYQVPSLEVKVEFNLIQFNKNKHRSTQSKLLKIDLLCRECSTAFHVTPYIGKYEPPSSTPNVVQVQAVMAGMADRGATACVYEAGLYEASEGRWAYQITSMPQRSWCKFQIGPKLMTSFKQQVVTTSGLL